MSTRKGTPHTQQIHRLKRISGQVQGVVSMVEENRYCVDILHQIKAIKSALAVVERNILQDHLDHCVVKAIASQDPKQAKEVIAEIGAVLKSVGVGK